METPAAAVTTTPLMSAKSAARYNTASLFVVTNVRFEPLTEMSSPGVFPWGGNQSEGARCPGHDR